MVASIYLFIEGPQLTEASGRLLNISLEVSESGRCKSQLFK